MKRTSTFVLKLERKMEYCIDFFKFNIYQERGGGRTKRNISSLVYDIWQYCCPRRMGGEIIDFCDPRKLTLYLDYPDFLGDQAWPDGDTHCSSLRPEILVQISTGSRHKRIRMFALQMCSVAKNRLGCLRNRKIYWNTNLIGPGTYDRCDARNKKDMNSTVSKLLYYRHYLWSAFIYTKLQVVCWPRLIGPGTYDRCDARNKKDMDSTFSKLLYRHYLWSAFICKRLQVVYFLYEGWHW